METPGYAKHPPPNLVRKIVTKMELCLPNMLKIDFLFIAQLEMLTDQVQVAKGMVEKNPSPATTEQLNVARKRRDGQHSKLEVLLRARENVATAIPQVHYMQQLRIAQLLRASHRNSEVTGSNPVEVLTFLGLFVYAIAEIGSITARFIVYLITKNTSKFF